MAVIIDELSSTAGGDVSDIYLSVQTKRAGKVAGEAFAVGHVDEIREVVRVVVYVNSSTGFTEHAQVANGASDVLLEIFGDAGRHVRSAVGVAALPLNAAVEVELVVGV